MGVGRSDTNRSRSVARWIVAFAAAVTGGCERKPPPIATRPPATVIVATPVAQEVVDFDLYTGALAPVAEVQVRPRVTGVIEKVHFEDGAEVAAGSPLIDIDPRPFDAMLRAAEGQVQLWEARLRNSEATLKRHEELLASEMVSKSETDLALAQRDEAAAGIETARAEVERCRLDLEFTHITAPIAGRASRALKTVGNLVMTGPPEATLLTSIVTVDPIHCYFDVDERAMQRYRSRRLAEHQSLEASPKSLDLPVDLRLATDDGWQHHGKLDFVENQVDSTTGTIRARAVFANPTRVLAPGYFARIRVADGEPYRALLVTEQAVGTDLSQKYLLVVDEQGVVAYRPVKLGTLHDGLRVITEGLAGNEQVVVNGLHNARPGAKVNVQRVEMREVAAPVDR